MFGYTTTTTHADPVAIRPVAIHMALAGRKPVVGVVPV